VGNKKIKLIMCGFGGVIGSKKKLHKSDLAPIASRVNFRGPDSCGIRIFNDEFTTTEEGPHGIFFNRLAIMDPDPRSDQPFENDRYMLAFNGEIYNFLSLKCKLEKEGIKFITTSDTEVLFHCLNIWGKDALPMLNGMFALFWLDKKERKFIVARDRLGIKPLYYKKDKSTFYYSSELQSILRMAGSNFGISAEAIDMYLWLQFIPTPFTAIKDIWKLPPGHYIEGNESEQNDVTVKCYLDAYEQVSSTNTNEATGLEAALKNSLERQLHADVPLGLFLSSGVDSSLLAAMVNKYFASNNDVNFFTVQFDENTISDESTDARNFIAGFNNSNLHCHTIRVNSRVIGDQLNDLYSYYDEPFGDHASLLNWMISQKAREFVTVAISGDGADELFWGYSRYQRWKKFERLNNIPLVPALARATSVALPERLKHNVQFVFEPDPVKRHFNFFLPSGMRYKLNDHITRYPMWSLKNVEKVRQRQDLPAVLDIKTYLADAMLYKVDRSSMASSLEVRVPYLDNEVLDFALSLPLSEKSNAVFPTKAPLKKLLATLAPHYIVDRPKKGFNFPLRSWLKDNWREQVLSTVDRGVLIEGGLEPKPYLNLINDFYLSRNDYFTDVWYIYNLSLWMKKIKASANLQ
jgi:asparagine synthase (glutamine-hydrolysing)